MDRAILAIAKYQTKVLVAESVLDQMTGLMHREPPLPHMVFPYKRAENVRFWMKNTKQALDLLFCFNGKIAQICKGDPYSTVMIGDDQMLSDLVIELPYGTCQKLGINLGDPVQLLK